MSPPIIAFESIDFDVLTARTVKTHRSVFFDESRPLVYKLYAPDWEFADVTANGFARGFYDAVLAPTIVGLIQDKQKRNRGYIMKRIPSDRFLDNIALRIFEPRAFFKLYRREITPLTLLWPRYSLRQDFVLHLLRTLFSRALTTNLIFAEMTPPNIWVDEVGYHIVDLDALREIDWIFCSDRDDPEYVRKAVNRRSINDSLRQLLTLHKLTYPGHMRHRDDMRHFWEALLRRNSLSPSQWAL